MVSKRFLILNIILFGIWTETIAQTETIIGNNGNLKLEKKLEIPLKEDKTIFQRVSDIEAINSKYFVVVDRSSPAVIIYSFSGEQIKVVSREGRGPFEYQKPSLVSTENNKFYVRDGFSLLAFNEKGDGIWQKIGFQMAFQDFLIKDDSLFVYHHTRYKDDDKNILSIFDLNSKTRIQAYGNNNNIDHLLSTFKGSGGLLRINNLIYYATPGRPVINYLNLEKRALGSFKFNDSDFKVEDTDLTANSFYKDIIEYITTNSRIVGLFKTEGYLIVQVEHGIVDAANENRFSKLFVFEQNTHQLIDSFTIPHSKWSKMGRQVRFSYKNTLYYVRESDTQPLTRFLCGWELTDN